MGATASTVKGWNQAEDSVVTWKADMLTLVNVTKFLAKAEKDHDILNASVQARVMATTKSSGSSWNIFSGWNIWTKVADAVTRKAIERSGLSRQECKDLIQMTVATIPKRVQDMHETIARAATATRQWITDITVEMETAKHLDGPSREAIKEKARQAFTACNEVQALCQNWHISDGIRLNQYFNQWRRPGDDTSGYTFDNPNGRMFDEIVTKTIVIQFKSSVFAILNQSASSRHLNEIDEIVVEIEDTASFVEVTEIALCSRLYDAVSQIKGMVTELENDLHTLRTRKTHMPNQV